ncbi:hypothetical protein B0J11DRAFT_458434, partial [Dendryphion nanum]
MAHFRQSIAELTQQQAQKPHPRGKWYPPALRWWNLVLATVVCWSLIAVLQYFLTKSQNEGGVIFAPRVNDLPLRQSFVYLYFPTILAVIFSIYIVWIDVDAKRYEPYHQLSKPGGALGKDSVLLHYPFDFIPIVPYFALKNRHWYVFWASAATVITTFGIVPLQAGIFSTEKITRTFPHTFSVSNRFIPASVQEENLGLVFARSAYGVVVLNETLPGFTARNYTLAPFTAHTPKSEAQYNGTWTANTTLYTVDVDCESAISSFDSDRTPEHKFNNWGNPSNCTKYVPGFGNDTIGGLSTNSTSSYTTKEFAAFYAGPFRPGLFQTDRRNAPVAFSLTRDFGCTNLQQTFFASFVRNRANNSDPLKLSTAIFCKTTYFEQKVQATVNALTKSPTTVVPLESKKPLTPSLLNVTLFEETVAASMQRIEFHGDNLPGSKLPRLLDRLYKSQLSMLSSKNTDLSPMAAFAALGGGRDMVEYLDPGKLAESYRTIYQLLFAGYMTEILQTNFSTATTEAAGTHAIHTEAVVLEPVFTYVVIGFLAFVSMASIALLLIGVVQRKTRKLASDPGAIMSVMSMTADNDPLLASFEDLDGCSNTYLQRRLKDRMFKLGDDDSQARIVEVPTSQVGCEVDGDIAKPTRPVEFRLFVAAPFVGLFVALAITLGILFYKSRPFGLPLPSKRPLIQSIVREYIPTAVATLIEPMWILINRLFCMLQPLEEMNRARAAPASKSIALNYNSLPPQLTIAKALRSRHFVLAIVCTMALLANVLATAFAALLFQETVQIPTSTSFRPQYTTKFVPITVGSGPEKMEKPQQLGVKYSGAFQGGTGEDFFLAAESNYTRNTTLPPWSDDKAFYLPFIDSNDAKQLQEQKMDAITPAIASSLDCKPLVFGEDYQISIQPILKNVTNPYAIEFIYKTTDRDGALVTCYPWDPLGFGQGVTILKDLPEETCNTGPLATELVGTLTPGFNGSVSFSPNGTEAQQEACTSTVVLGWIRQYRSNCDRPLATLQATANNTFMMSCRPKVIFGSASIIVDSTGTLLQPAKNFEPDSDQSAIAHNAHFSNRAWRLYSQANMFMFRVTSSRRSLWHNNTVSGEFFHYFIRRAAGTMDFNDPSKPLPTFDQVAGPASKAYTRLFALWMSLNRDLLLEPVPANTAPIPGSLIRLEERLHFKTELFVISEIILGIYILVAILVYLKRPGQYLARMPTCIAAIVALFAASAAVKDLEGTSEFPERVKVKYLEDKGWRYGYGSYVGGDGSVHVGIEKMPFVRRRKDTTFEGSRYDRERRKMTARVETIGLGERQEVVRKESWIVRVKRVGTG